MTDSTSPATSTSRHTAKLALGSVSVSALYLIPGAAGAGIVHIDNDQKTISLTDPTDTQVFWDVDGDGNNDFVLYKSDSLYLDTYDTLNGSALNGRGMVQKPGQGQDVVQRLGSSFQVGPTLAAGYQWGASQQTLRTVVSSSGTSVGNDLNAGGFTAGLNLFGFRFENASGVHYGWAELNIVLSGANASFTVTQWAYDDVADTGIHVPDTGAAGVPEPSTPALALLGLGAAGVARWRKGKRADAIAA